MYIKEEADEDVGKKDEQRKGEEPGPFSARPFCPGKGEAAQILKSPLYSDLL
jgi:hypothetical protein